MNKKFNFDDVGKQTPYHAPDGFFIQLQKDVLERTQELKRTKRNRRLMIASVTTLAAVLFGLLFAPLRRDACSTSSLKPTVNTDQVLVDPIDQWIHDLSDEELEELICFSTSDPFMYQLISN